MEVAGSNRVIKVSQSVVVVASGKGCERSAESGGRLRPGMCGRLQKKKGT